MTRIESLLRKEIGLDAASIGTSLIERTVRLRMKALGLKQAEDYERLLKTSSTALEELIEAVVVTETWFFRDREPFAAFAQMALQWLPKNPAVTLRALSVPCSSGEEPYSLAMALLDVGFRPAQPMLSEYGPASGPEEATGVRRPSETMGAHAPPAGRFVIDGVDISARALARAQHAVYGRNSFRGKDLAFRDRHFRPQPMLSQSGELLSQRKQPQTTGLSRPREHGLGYALNPAIRECVRFHRANLLGEDFLTDRAPYDFIFCRNLLIYFDRATQVRALEKLHRLLTAEGVLFVGPAELPLVVGNGFATANLPMAFACRKATPAKHLEGRNAEKEIPEFLISKSEKERGAGRILRVPESTPVLRRAALGSPPSEGYPGRSPESQTADRLARRQTSVHTTSTPPSDLEAARQLADAGRLEEAAAACESHLRKEGPSAQAYYLLGLLCDARADPQASDYYRKALYLEPNHHDTLLQMSLLLEKGGDHAGARAYRRRAQRAQQNPMETHSLESRNAGKETPDFQISKLGKKAT